jgi:hypothetical protein
MKSDANIDEIRDTLRVLRNRHANEDAAPVHTTPSSTSWTRSSRTRTPRSKTATCVTVNSNRRNTQLLSKIQELEAREQ